MRQKGRHLVLESRLEALAERIEKLRRKLSAAKGGAKIEELGTIEELEDRQKKLAGRLQELDREGPGIGSDVKAELEAMTDDLTGAVEDFMVWADSGFASRPPKR